MKIMSIDSSSVTASVSITDNGKIMSEKFINNGLTHSQTLMPMVNESLCESGLAVKDIDLFAVTFGPGSFTGIRIGIASVKGMADAVGKECYAVSTLEAIAEPLTNEDAVVCAVMDARCNQVYTALFYKGERLCEDKAVLIDELGTELKKYNKKVVFIGDGAVLCYDKLCSIILECEVAKENIRYIHASSIARLAEKHILNGAQTVKSTDLIPFYLRLPQAERELNNKKKLK